MNKLNKQPRTNCLRQPALPSMVSMAPTPGNTMTDNTNLWPSVSSSHQSHHPRQRAKGLATEKSAKNLLVRTGCHCNLRIGTYNRTLSFDAKTIELEEELSRIKFLVIRICETRWKGEGCITFSNSGHCLYYKGGDAHYKGVALILYMVFTSNCNVISLRGVSQGSTVAHSVQ